MLHIKPQHVEAVYECLRNFEPWRSLGLPHAEEVEIHVKARRDCYAEYIKLDGVHKVMVSSILIGGFETLASVVGHEMLHLAQEIHGTSNSAQHNAEFRRLARIACRDMIWDERAFIG